MKALHYKDIALLPRYSELKSRAQANTSCSFLGRLFKVPVVPANMKCVINEKIAEWLSENDYFYVMHRFGIDNLKFVEAAQSWKTISISVGVKEEDKAILKLIADRKLRVDFITIDIAHGHSILMKEMLEYIKTLSLGARIIAGNVCTTQGTTDLIQWGADSVKVGIGQGGVCSTKNKTGITNPMFSCLLNISAKVKNVPIIADGGIKEHGDIAKAIRAGATMVMCGGLFSRLIDSPAEIIDNHKIYYGSASQFNKGEYRNVEGIKRSIELDTMTYKDKLIEINQDLQSTISYVGGRVLDDIRSCAYELVTSWEV